VTKLLTCLYFFCDRIKILFIFLRLYKRNYKRKKKRKKKKRVVETLTYTSLQNFFIAMNANQSISYLKSMEKKKSVSAVTNEKVSTYISDDLSFSILSKLPLKSFKRFQCVRKSWSLLYENHHFMSIFRSDFLSNSPRPITTDHLSS
jgi:hypothetical protein